MFSLALISLRSLESAFKKLNCVFSYYQEVESHREAAQEDGEQSMEELLWILDQTKKELDFAKKVGPQSHELTIHS